MIEPIHVCTGICLLGPKLLHPSSCSSCTVACSFTWRVYSGCFGIGGVDGGDTIAVELLAQFYLVVRSQGLAIKLDVGQGPLERFQNGP